MSARPQFGHEYLRRLLSTAASRFDVRPLAERFAAADGRPVLFLRHDVDVCLERALDVAALEHEMGVRATYMVMVDSPLYELDAAALAALGGMGHEVGLHVVPGGDARLRRSRARLQRVLGRDVRSISFHQPKPGLLRGPDELGGLVNAYARSLMGCYLSDSAGRWRCGDPLRVLSDGAADPVQLLIHPIYWGAEAMAPEDRLEAFYRERSAGLPAADVPAFDEALAAAVFPARRRGR